MDFYPAAALILSLMVVPVVGAYGLFANWRAKRRNAHGACAACGTAWRDIGPDAARYYVQGREVCASCATRLRRRLLVELATLGAVTVVALGLVVGGAAGALALGYRYGVWAWVIAVAPPFALGAATWGTVRQMRAVNRQRLDRPDVPPMLGEGGA